MYNCSVTSLSIRANDIRSAGASTLATGLKKNIGLISLDLADNDIGDRSNTFATAEFRLCDVQLIFNSSVLNERRR